MKILLKRIFLTFAVVAIAGCGSKTITVNTKGALGNYLAADFSQQLRKYYPVRTNIKIKLDSQYEKQVDAALRQKGYSVADDGTALIIYLDMIDDKTYRATYFFNGATLSRVYVIKNNSIMATSPWSATNIKSLLSNDVGFIDNIKVNTKIYKGLVFVKHLYIRDKAAPNSKVISTLKKGDVVNYYKHNNTYLELSTGGYVLKRGVK